MEFISPHLPFDKLSGILDSAIREETDKLIQILENLQSEPLETNVENVHFEAFIPFSPDDPGPTIWFYLDGKNKLVGSEKPGFYAGNAWEIMVPNDVPSYDDKDSNHFFDSDYSNILADIVVKWFAECWWKAGGWKYPVPATICVHEDAGYLGRFNITKAKNS